VVASTEGGIDAGAALKKVLAEHGGRGGGNARIAQGTVPTLDALDAAVAAFSLPG
jgi:alanyl-tRNA synthetase